MKLLENKIVIITGASRGIGKSIAEECVQQGATVVFTYLSSKEKAEALEKELSANGGKAKGFRSDASKFDEAQKLVDDVIAEYGTIDVLVNNAGITRDTLLMRMSEEQWDEVINTNLKSAFNLTKAVQRPMLKARKGSIVNMSSVVGVKGNAGQANYAASKAGLIGFTKSVAAELGSRNIRCNAIAPGFIETEMTQGMKPEALAKMAAGIPLRRMGRPDEIAHSAAFIFENDYYTGRIIECDGGLRV